MTDPMVEDIGHPGFPGANSNPRTTRVAAYGLLVEETSILLCRLSNKALSHQGSWTLPGGGLEFGEDPADAMVREVSEETGLLVRPTGIAGIDSIRLDNHEMSQHGIRIIYFTEILGGEIRHEVSGSTDLCAWYSHDRARQLRLVELADIGLSLAFPASLP